jgi:hypothetical protein
MIRYIQMIFAVLLVWIYINVELNPFASFILACIVFMYMLTLAISLIIKQKNN